MFHHHFLNRLYPNWLSLKVWQWTGLGSTSTGQMLRHTKYRWQNTVGLEPELSWILISINRILLLYIQNSGKGGMTAVYGVSFLMIAFCIMII